MRGWLATALLLFCLAWPPPAEADQNDPKLDVLFADLRQAARPDVVNALVGNIWRVWLQSDSATVNLLMQRTLEAMSEGRLDDSLNVLNDMVELAPDFAEAWNKRATVLYMLNRYDDSLADVERTLALEPRHFGALSGLGLIHSALGNDAKALEAYERALEVNPHIAHARSEVKRLRKKVRGQKI